MTSKENLMVVAMEECAEIQQEISKAIRFGVDNHHPNEPHIMNGQRIMREFHQLRAVMDMLVIKGIIPDFPEVEQNQIYRVKVDAIKKWEEYSKSVGAIN